MAQPAWLNKYLRMKPEVTKVFDDLEQYHNWCRFNLEDYNPSNLYRENTNWGKFARHTGLIPRHYSNNKGRFNHNKPWRK